MAGLKLKLESVFVLDDLAIDPGGAVGDLQLAVDSAEFGLDCADADHFELGGGVQPEQLATSIDCGHANFEGVDVARLRLGPGGSLQCIEAVQFLLAEDIGLGVPQPDGLDEAVVDDLGDCLGGEIELLGNVVDRVPSLAGPDDAPVTNRPLNLGSL